MLYCARWLQEAVLFGWGKDAPGLQLPEGVGFAVGPGTGIRTVVMQARFTHVFRACCAIALKGLAGGDLVMGPNPLAAPISGAAASLALARAALGGS